MGNNLRHNILRHRSFTFQVKRFFQPVSVKNGDFICFVSKTRAFILQGIEYDEVEVFAFHFGHRMLFRVICFEGKTDQALPRFFLLAEGGCDVDGFG